MSQAPHRIYLASRSPRRRELLTQIGVLFDSLPFRAEERADPAVDETPLPRESAPDYVSRLARTKSLHGLALVTLRRRLQQPVLAADTALEIDGEIIGKPRNAADATAILQRLSGRSHRVLTGIALAHEERLGSALSISEVRFRALEAEEIRRYVASGDPMDKAGAYGIQGRAALFIEHIAGSYSGIMGLPLCETGQLLRAFDYQWTA